MPEINTEDTIVAIGSSQAPAQRGAVRLTGPDCIAIASALGIEATRERSAHRVDAEIDLGQPLGKVPVRALLWPTKRSYTGQPSLEIHTYGSLPILQAIVRAAIAAGSRAAQPGEFTLRAFLAGRLDLTQAEAVLGVIDAQQRHSLDHALRQLAGNLSRPMEFLRGQLLDLLADVEAGLDFVDEDIQFVSDEDLVSRLRTILEAVTIAHQQLVSRTEDKSEVTIALRGLPNAGKSRLLNALCGHEAAIVADVAGTTRDVVAVPTKIGDYPVVLIDTAGIESADGDSLLQQISAQAQQHASRAGSEAELRLWCVDCSSVEWRATGERLQRLARSDRRNESLDLWVATKCDQADGNQADGNQADRNQTDSDVPSPWIATSALNGTGMGNLRRHLVCQLDLLNQSESTSVAGTAARCGGSLQAATTAIEAAIGYVDGEDGHEYVSSELRLAAKAIGEVTGAVYTDDILDRVFSRFCIGK